MNYVNLRGIEYNGEKAIVLREYMDSNNKQILLDLFVLSDKPYIVRGVVLDLPAITEET